LVFCAPDLTAADIAMPRTTSLAFPRSIGRSAGRNVAGHEVRSDLDTPSSKPRLMVWESQRQRVEEQISQVRGAAAIRFRAAALIRRLLRAALLAPGCPTAELRRRNAGPSIKRSKQGGKAG
jgi:hypothetical protein